MESIPNHNPHLWDEKEKIDWVAGSEGLFSCLDPDKNMAFPLLAWVCRAPMKSPSGTPDANDVSSTSGESENSSDTSSCPADRELNIEDLTFWDFRYWSDMEPSRGVSRYNSAGEDGRSEWYEWHVAPLTENLKADSEALKENLDKRDMRNVYFQVKRATGFSLSIHAAKVTMEDIGRWFRTYLPSCQVDAPGVDVMHANLERYFFTQLECGWILAYVGPGPNIMRWVINHFKLKHDELEPVKKDSGQWKQLLLWVVPLPDDMDERRRLFPNSPFTSPPTSQESSPEPATPVAFDNLTGYAVLLKFRTFEDRELRDADHFYTARMYDEAHLEWTRRVRQGAFRQLLVEDETFDPGFNLPEFPEGIEHPETHTNIAIPEATDPATQFVPIAIWWVKGRSATKYRWGAPNLNNEEKFYHIFQLKKDCDGTSYQDWELVDLGEEFLKMVPNKEGSVQEELESVRITSSSVETQMGVDTLSSGDNGDTVMGGQ